MSMELGPYTNFHELNQDWFLDEFNKVLKEWAEMKKSFSNLNDAFNDLHDYVQDYFKNLDVQEEINNKLNEMYANGELEDIINTIFYKIEKDVVFNNISSLSNKRFICIGDSYAGGYTPETESIISNGWAKQMQKSLSINDNDFYISHEGGTGFANAGNSKVWGDTISTIEVNKPETIDYVIFCGGYNDASKSVNEVNTGIIHAITETKKRFTKAKILIGFVGMTGENYNAFQAIKRTFLAYSSNSISGSYIYMNGVEKSLYSLSLLSESDKHHPTKEGNKIIANSIIKFLCCGNVEIDISGSTIINPIADIKNTSANFQYKNGKCSLYIEEQTININSGNVTLNKYGIELFNTLLTPLFNNPPNDNYSVHCVVVANINSTTRYFDAIAQIYRSNMNTYNLLITLINDEKTNYLTIDSLKQIQIPSLKLQGELFTTFQ